MQKLEGWEFYEAVRLFHWLYGGWKIAVNFFYMFHVFLLLLFFIKPSFRLWSYTHHLGSSHLRPFVLATSWLLHSCLSSAVAGQWTDVTEEVVQWKKSCFSARLVSVSASLCRCPESYAARLEEAGVQIQLTKSLELHEPVCTCPCDYSVVMWLGKLRRSSADRRWGEGWQWNLTLPAVQGNTWQHLFCTQ